MLWKVATTTRPFCLSRVQAQEFVLSKDIDLALKDGVLGTNNKKTGQTFALMLLSPADHVQLSVQNHSALISGKRPPLTEPDGYYFGHVPEFSPSK